MEKDLREIESVAYKTIQTIQGDADAKATEIYANSYNKSKESRSLYNFVKTLKTYQTIIDKNTTLVLTTDSALYKLLSDGKTVVEK
jgi:membrane protease subunit HflC